MNFTPTNNTETIDALRAKLYQKLSAPVDAMWEMLYIASSQDYLIEELENTIGYCCINEEACLTQIFLEDEQLCKMDKVIEGLITNELIKSASFSSKEAIAFNACLVHSKQVKTNTFCFEHQHKVLNLHTELNLELVSEKEIPEIKAFLKEQVGMDDTFGYTENLVSRKEIYRLKQADNIVATSECRISDSQEGIADIGFIVNKAYRGRGIATQIMQQQVNKVLNAGRKPICSTTVDNIASRKAIERSGFYCSNVIFDISFA